VQDTGTVQGICRELETMASLRFPHICQVHGGCVINKKEVWLILEYVEGGNLNDFLTEFGPLRHELQLSFFIQSAKSINYLHSSPSPILHRDIKSSNFLVRDKSELLLTDFGLSKTAEFVTSQTTIGTFRWAAPEVLNKSPKWSEKADIYSLGMVFFEIVSCKIPFNEDKNFMRIMEKIVNGTRPIIPDSCPKASFATAIHSSFYTNIELYFIFPHQGIFRLDLQVLGSKSIKKTDITRTGWISCSSWKYDNITPHNTKQNKTKQKTKQNKKQNKTKNKTKQKQTNKQTKQYKKNK
jgi:serine/threonine protein kinase